MILKSMPNTFTILIVDDDTDIGAMLKMMMEYKGYSVMLLNKADKTIETLHNNSIKLVILDMLIAGINGTDVCQKIRNDKHISHIPILMISALPDARQVCIDAGATDFISKPFEMEEVLSKVAALINQESRS